jgi:7-carboxy-7-deazaguanine synthase
MDMRDHYQVNEIFDSIQGEGVLAGVPATFIRLQGCTVGCPWCDTKYTWLKGGERMSVQEITNRANHKHVVITGGEPTLYNLDSLISQLENKGKYVQLETSGQQWLKGELTPRWITWSPKENLEWNAPIEFYVHANEVKWVVDENLTFQTVWRTWEAFREARPYSLPYFVLMPEGCPPRKEMVEKVFTWLELHWVKGANSAHWNTWRYGDRLQYRIGVK